MDSDFEKRHVKKVYDEIANHFSTTRYKAWPTVGRYMEGILPVSIGVDVGCGNGKNMLIRPDLLTFGLDLSLEFTKICQGQGLEALQGTMLSLPFRSNSMDFSICIAAIHHLCSVERRLQAISELIRILKPGGTMLLYVWAFEQPKDSNLYRQGDKLQFLTEDRQDVLVPWNLSADPANPITQLRYYHLFKQYELDELLKNCNDQVEIVESGYDRDNWFVISRKKETKQ